MDKKTKTNRAIIGAIVKTREALTALNKAKDSPTRAEEFIKLSAEVAELCAEYRRIKAEE